MINLHQIMPCSLSNGPGNRLVVWFQGCSLACPGCFNPEMHSQEPRWEVSVAWLMERILREARRIEGISLTGGEPFQQSRELLELLRMVRQRTRLSVLVFTGYEIREILEGIDRADAILGLIDVLVAGRFDANRPCADPLISSTNQRVHLLTERHGPDDLTAIPGGEILIHPGGTVEVTGLTALHLPQKDSSLRVPMSQRGGSS